jgi:hypothetical protein
MKVSPGYNWDSLEEQIFKTTEVPRDNAGGPETTEASLTAISEDGGATSREWSCGCSVVRSRVDLSVRCVKCGNIFHEVLVEE